MWSVTTATPPTEEPVSLVDAKLHLRVDDNAEDVLISNLIVAARRWCENFQRRAYVTQTLQLTLDRFPFRDTIQISRPPLQSVTAVRFTDELGVERTFDAANYVVDAAGEPGRVTLRHEHFWPTTILQSAAAVQVEYVGGYGDAADVPQNVKQAMLLLIGLWYEQRESAVVGQTVNEVPMAVESLLWQDRVFELVPA